MTLPAIGGLPSVKPQVTRNCTTCGDHTSVPEGNRMPPCACASLPLSERTVIDVYQRVSDTPGYEFYAVALPGGDQRPVTTYGSSHAQVLSAVKRSLDV